MTDIADKFTKEEVEALPQTTQVFDRPSMIFDQHEWRQEGYMITDVCHPSRPDCHHVGIPIPTGKVLVKKGDGYDLVNEGR